MRNLIQEAKDRGYRKGTPIRYVPHAIDYVEGDYFELDEYGNVCAYAKPKHERKSFDDNRHDQIYEASTDRWVEIVDLSKRSDEQKEIDRQNYDQNNYL